MPKPKCQATCHPTRPHHARGLCQTCYARFLWQKGDKQEQADKWQEYYNKNKADLIKKACDRNRKKLYGIDPEQYDKLLYEQGGMCAICGREPTRSKNTTGTLHVDHNHTTGKIRGLLCTSCNNGLGRFKDDPILLESAASYLRDND